MRNTITKYLVCLAVLLYVVYASPATFRVPVENWYTIRSSNSTIDFGAQAEFSIRQGLQDVLEQNPDMLPDTEIILEFFDNEFSAAVGIELLIDFFEEGVTFVPGNPLSAVVSITGQAATVYDIAQLSGTANTAVLSDKTIYPFFSRSYIPADIIAGSTVETIQSFFDSEGLGWNEIALLSTSEEVGVSSSQSFLEILAGFDDLEVLTYQQYLQDTDDVSVELGEIERSGARVIVTYAFQGYEVVLAEADERGLISDEYVWFVGPTISGFATFFLDADGNPIDEVVQQLEGTIGSLVFLPREGERYERYLAAWEAADPALVPGSGPGTIPPLFPTLTFDVGVLIGLAVDAADKEGLLDGPISAEKWTEIIRSQEFMGATGGVIFDDIGNRPMPVAVVNWRTESVTWETVAIWDPFDGVEFLDDIDIIWQGNTTVVPDLDIRTPFGYWSCHDKESGFDSTGKEISIHTPDSSDVDEISSHYQCDHFIDCQNMSDESYGCVANFTILFICFGIITGLLVFITCLFLPFVIIFGYIVPRKRVRASSPTFLMIMIFSGILGYCSTFAWYGKPHPVACAFQPWLLGLAVVSMISALCAKTWRIWRIFNKKFSRTIISDKLLVILYIIMMLPAILILILWTIVSTPTAEIQEHDGEDHYVCATGGFTGEPGGLVFFFILVGYEGLVLLFAAFLSIATRKVPMFFNESKLIALSIYNLGFLAIVCIPVFLVLNEFNPFAAWVIRTLAILYAFTATLWLQFIPKIIGVVIIDKFGDAKINQKSIRGSNNTQTQSAG